MLPLDKIKDVSLLAERLKEANSFHAVPALMKKVIDHIRLNESSGDYRGITKIFIGGDYVPTDILKEIRSVFTQACIYVLYGPTESTVFVTANYYNRDVDVTRFQGSNIGKPNSNGLIYILNKQKHLVPIGVVGEIFVGGSCLARGYLNNEKLTNDKFVKNPFRDNERMYSTGDMGRWLPDGTIEFKGRIDEQVKIRGFRIELGEIETALGEIESIEGALVVVRKNAEGENELYAYLISHNKLNVSEIRFRLGRFLPAYMIPSHFIQLDSFPLNSNGKIDKKNLPYMAEHVLSVASEYLAPRDEYEEKIMVVWKELLDKERIGVRDNFFELGGHSLKVTQLISRMNKLFLVKLNIQEIYTNPTIESISDQVKFIVNQNKQRDNKKHLTKIEL